MRAVTLPTFVPGASWISYRVTRGPETMPMTFASTPWWPSAWTSVSAVRSSACCGCFSVAREWRRRLGSGRTYAACSVAGGSKRESAAVSLVGSSFHSGSSVSWSTSTGERRRRVRDDVGILDRAVHGRRERNGLVRRLGNGNRNRPRDRAARLGSSGVRRLRGGGGAAKQRTERSAGEQHDADGEGERAEDDRPGSADEALEAAVERAAELPAVARAQKDQKSHRGDDEPHAERTEVDEPGAADHERSHADERERQHDPRGADQPVEAVRDGRADRAAVPAEPEDDGQEQPQRDETEPDELGMSGASSPPSLDTRRRPRAHLVRRLLSTHERRSSSGGKGLLPTARSGHEAATGSCRTWFRPGRRERSCGCPADPAALG